MENKNKAWPYTIFKKINSRWTTDLHVKDNTVKVLEENSIEYLHGMEVDKDFLGSTQKH